MISTKKKRKEGGGENDGDGIVKKIGDKKIFTYHWAGNGKQFIRFGMEVFELFADPIPVSLPRGHKFSASLKIASNWKRGCIMQLEAKKNERDGSSIAIVTRDDPFIRGPFAPIFSFSQASYCS